MNKFIQSFLAKTSLGRLSVAIIVLVGLSSSGLYALAAATSEFTQAINAGSLSVDIVDGSYAPVASPAFSMGAASFSFDCQTSTGVFGTTTQRIYVKNPDAADNGWSISLAGSAPTASWTSGSNHFDFNDDTTAGCGDGADSDSYKGQMTIDPTSGTIAKGNCSTCNVTNITKGSSAGFVEGSVDNVTLLTGAAGSDDIGDWTFTGVNVSQKIPAEQPAASDYTINLTVTVTTL